MDDMYTEIVFSLSDDYTNIRNKYTADEHKSMLKLYLSLYNGCLKFKEDVKNNPNKIKPKNIDCTPYYENFKMHTQAYISKIDGTQS